jgi:hypothetical protein
VLLLDRTIAAARMLSVNAIAAGGGIAICGSYGGGDFGDGMPTGSGTSRALAALYDTAGTIAWTRTLDSPSYATATDCVESGRLYVVGGFRTSVGTITGTIDGTSTGTAYDGFAAAINLDGSIEWLARSGVDIVAQPFVTRVGSRLYAIVESNMGSTWGHFTGASALGIAELSTTSSTPIGDATFPVALVPYGVAGDASTGRVYVLGMGSSSFTWGATAHTVSSVSSIVLALDP